MTSLLPLLLLVPFVATPLSGQSSVGSKRAETKKAEKKAEPKTAIQSDMLSQTFFELVALSRLHGKIEGGSEIGFYMEYVNNASSPIAILAFIPKDTGIYGEVKQVDKKDFVSGWKSVNAGEKLRVFVNRTLPVDYYLQTVAVDKTKPGSWPKSAVIPKDEKTLEQTFKKCTATSRGAEVEGLVVCSHAFGQPKGTQTSDAPGTTFTEKLGMKFKLIPAGSFTMGSLSGESEEQPAHKVTISRPFLMQKTHVTVAQFRAFVEATAYRTEAEDGDGTSVYVNGGWAKRKDVNWRNPSFSQQESCPVVCITWKDAQAFIAWLNRQDPGKGYRLPTEAEWEYACRAGISGDQVGDLGAVAWHAYNSDGRTHPVGTKQPNAWGLYDMLGNAWQWCQDWHNTNYYQSSPSVDPQGPASGSYRVIRGGGYGNDATLCRFAYRRGVEPGVRTYGMGFRIVAQAPNP